MWGGRLRPRRYHTVTSPCKPISPRRHAAIAFLDQLLDHGEIKAELLAEDKEITERIETHPLLYWKPSTSVNTRANSFAADASTVGNDEAKPAESCSPTTCRIGKEYLPCNRKTAIR